MIGGRNLLIFAAIQVLLPWYIWKQTLFFGNLACDCVTLLKGKHSVALCTKYIQTLYPFIPVSLNVADYETYMLENLFVYDNQLMVMVLHWGCVAAGSFYCFLAVIWLITVAFDWNIVDNHLMLQVNRPRFVFFKFQFGIWNCIHIQLLLTTETNNQPESCIVHCNIVVWSGEDIN